MSYITRIPADWRVTLAYGKFSDTRPGAWKNSTTTLQGLTRDLTTHKVGDKDGPCFMQGEALGGTRTAKAMDGLSIIALDVDDGTPSETLDALVDAKGLFCIRYSTHSHGKGELTIKESDWLKWSKDRPGADVAAYLIEKKRYRPEIAASAVMGARVQTPEGAVFPVTHAPTDKNRLVFILAKPWRAMQGDKPQDQTIAEWKRAYMNFARWLGVTTDASCEDPSRLLFAPRHPPTPAKAPETRVFQGGAIDIFALPDAGAKAFTFAAAAAEMGANGSASHRLKGWAAKHGDTFQIAQAVEYLAPDKALEWKGAILIVPCPFEDEHTVPGGSGTHVMNAGDGSDTAAFVIKCKHNACAGRDRLAFVDKMICDGWFEESTLTDSDYNLELEDEAKGGDRRPALVVNCVDHSEMVATVRGALVNPPSRNVFLSHVL